MGYIEAPVPPADGAQSAEIDNLAMLGVLLILAGALAIGRLVQRMGIQWIGEAGAGLLLGLLAGAVMHVLGVSESFGLKISFKAIFFLLVLMPVIMFHAGYTLDAQPFLRNVGSVCMTAFLGTTISTFVIGFMMWSFGRLGWCYQMPFLYNLTFGAIISATDPVAVLAVFESLGANPDLYINVFGESVLNDAVAMVLYNTVSRFLDTDVTAGGIFAGIGIFVGIFLGSMAVGMAVGIVACITFKTGFFHAEIKRASLSEAKPPHSSEKVDCGEQQLSDGGQPGQDHSDDDSSEEDDEIGACYETALVLICAYISYMLASAAYLSGITAIVSTGMIMNKYLRPNISEKAEMRVSIVSKTLAITFELFAFVYIGLSVLQEQQYDIFAYTTLCLVALAVSRAFNIYPLVAVVNFLRPKERRISHKQQLMQWWSGLRGPMAFALALDASEKYGEYGKVMKTCTLYLILITVLINGGTSAYLMRYLRLRVEDDKRDEKERVRLLRMSAAAAAPGDSPWGPLGDAGPTPPASCDALGLGGGGESSAGGASAGGAGGSGRVSWVEVESQVALTSAGSEGMETAGTSNGHISTGRSGSLGLAALHKGPSKLLKSIRGFNGGRLAKQLESLDQIMTSVLVADRATVRSSALLATRSAATHLSSCHSDDQQQHVHALHAVSMPASRSGGGGLEGGRRSDG